MSSNAKRKKIGLALGSGGFRGFSHIGVIQVLLENNIPIDFISGSSIGALAAAYYAFYGEISGLEEKFLDTKKGRLLGLSDFGFRGGLLSTRKYEKIIENLLGRHTFEETKIPVKIIATDLASGEPFVFHTGKLSLAVRASSSVPVVFEPVKYHGHNFIDGALSSPVPVDALQGAGADEIIAVNLYHKKEFTDKRFTFTKVALRSTRIALYNLSQSEVKNASVVINPDNSYHIQNTSLRQYFTRDIMEKMIYIGRKEAEKALPSIKKLLK